MSVVILGGHDRMVCRYKNICGCHGCKAKVFTQPKGDLAKVICCADLIVLFTEALSHSTAIQARKIAAAGNITLVQSRSGSCSALQNILANQTAGKEVCMKQR